MRFTVIALVVVAAVLVARDTTVAAMDNGCSGSNDCPAARMPPPLTFDEWAVRFRQSYKTDDERQRAQDNYHKTLEAVEQLSKEQPHATFRANAFSGLSNEEWLARFPKASAWGTPEARAARGHVVGDGQGTGGSDSASGVYVSVKTFSSSEISAALAQPTDWQSGANPLNGQVVTRVKNQGSCGSCYVFSMIAAVESMFAIKGQPMAAFSEQYVLDCMHAKGLNGCVDGDPAVVGKLLETATLPLERDYEYMSYAGALGVCNASVPLVPGSSVSTMWGLQVQPGQTMEDLMATWVNRHGPLLVMVDASGANWQTYSSGVMTCQPTTALNHGVLVVGYGTDPKTNTQYWKIKNSWSPVWGESGYLKLARGVNACNVNAAPIPVVV